MGNTRSGASGLSATVDVELGFIIDQERDQYNMIWI